MARLVGVDLPREKRVEVALTYIFGVGRTSASKALAATGVNPDTRVKDLGDEELVSSATGSRTTSRSRETFAARCRRTSAARWRSARYEGIRHRRGLPVRGQRTKTNARTRKGPKRTVAGKKKAGK